MNKPKIRFNEFENTWTKSKLGELYEIYSGNTPSRSDSRNYQNGEIPWIKTTDLNNSIICSNEEKISVYGATRLKVLPEKSVLIAMYGGFNQIGRTGLLAYPATINQALAALMPVNEINPNFLLNFLNFKKESWRNVAASSRKDPNITKNDVEKFKISFPSLDEQSAIGSLFRTLDDLLARYKDNLANYQSLKATMLSKMFPKAGQIAPEIRLDGFEGEWEEKQFSKLVKRVTQSSDSDSLPKVEFEDIISGQGRLNKDITSKFDNRKGIHFKPGYTLYGKLRPYLNNWLLPKFEGVALGDFWVFDPNGNDSNFIYYLVQSNRYQKVANDTSGTKMPRSDWKSVSSTIFAIPQTITEQQAIGAYFSNLDNLINSHQEKITQLETLKKKLLQDMFI